MKAYIDCSRFKVQGSRLLNSKLKNQNSKLIFVCLLFFLPLALFAADLKPTPFFMDFYGSIEGAKAGDEITVYSGNGGLCGKFTITKDGEYGFLHVYGDDPGTPDSEGAKKNESLIFKLNGTQLNPSSGEAIRWLDDGQKQRVDFKR